MQEQITTYFSIIFSMLFLIVSFGLIMDFLERLTLSYGASMFGKKTVTYISAFIGTPIHELGHLFFAVLFGHTITKVQLIPKKGSINQGILGCVQHSWNNKNFYQKFGNFFIGIGPMFSGPITILIILRIFLPETYFDLYNSMNDIILNNNNVIEIFLLMIKSMFKMFTFSNITNPLFYLFLFLSTNIASHMGLSFSDVKHSVFSLIFLFIIICLVALAVPTFPTCILAA